MGDREERSWQHAAEILCQVVCVHDRRSSRAASSAGAQASSSSGLRGRTPKERVNPAERDYVRAVLDYYLWLPGTATVTSRHDRRCAQGLFRRGVAVDVVKSAMLVAVARRTFRRGDPLPRVRAVHYFLPAVEELLECPYDPDYIRYLEQKLRPLAALKAAETGRSRAAPSS
jgi:hypothetical protein